MKRFALILLAVVVIIGVSRAAHDVDPSTTIGTATRSELFRVIFGVPQSVVDSARVWYSHHAGQDTTVSEDALFDELMGGVAGRLRGWEENYKKSLSPVTTTF